MLELGFEKNEDDEVRSGGGFPIAFTEMLEPRRGAPFAGLEGATGAVDFGVVVPLA